MKTSYLAASVVFAVTASLISPTTSTGTEPDKPSEPGKLRLGVTYTAGPTSIDERMRAEIRRVVSEGRSAPRLRVATASTRRLAALAVRCASFSGERYCLNYGWTDRSEAELVRVLGAADEGSDESTGALGVRESLEQRLGQSADSRAVEETAELESAARSLGKVLVLRHDIEGQPIPSSFRRSHPDAIELMRRPPPDGDTSLYTILKPGRTSEQRTKKWCGPATMQMIAWNWSDRKRRQRRWARRLETTGDGTAITSMVRGVNKYTGYDKKRFAGKYITLDISNYGYAKWYKLNRKHFLRYAAPTVMHPQLKKKFFKYLDRNGSGHFQVGRGYRDKKGKRDRLFYFEPWNPRRFGRHRPFVRRNQERRALKLYRANKANQFQNIGV